MGATSLNLALHVHSCQVRETFLGAFDLRISLSHLRVGNSTLLSPARGLARALLQRVPRLLFHLLCLAGIVLTAGTAEARPPEFSFYFGTAADAAKPPGTLLRAEKIAMPALYRAKGWRVLYSTRDYYGRPLLGSATVVIPTNPPKAGSLRKIVAWAHPTVGTSRTCAPSLRSTPLTPILGVNEFVGLDYAVVATDYPGLGTPGPVGYLVGKGQAYSVFDAVRAMRQLPSHGTGRDLALFGFSQGGHAVLSAASVAPSYAPEFLIRGVAAIAPPTDLHQLMLRNANSLEGRVLLAFTLQSWAVKYGLSLRAIVKESALSSILAINQICIDNFSGKVDIYNAQKKLDPRFLLTDPNTVPGWSTAIADNTITTLPAKTPFLILQGTEDAIVKPDVTRAMVRRNCKSGARIKFVSLQGSGHGGAEAAGKNTAISWIAERLAGQPDKLGCP